MDHGFLYSLSHLCTNYSSQKINAENYSVQSSSGWTFFLLIFLDAHLARPTGFIINDAKQGTNLKKILMWAKVNQVLHYLSYHVEAICIETEAYLSEL